MRLVNVDNITDKEHIYKEQLRWRRWWLGVYQILHSIHRKKLSVMAYQTQIYIYFYNRCIHSTYTEITLCIFEQKISKANLFSFRALSKSLLILLHILDFFSCIFTVDFSYYQPLLETLEPLLNLT